LLGWDDNVGNFATMGTVVTMGFKPIVTENWQVIQREGISIWISWITLKIQAIANQLFNKTNLFVWITFLKVDH
jgi:hypothetical protein